MTITQLAGWLGEHVFCANKIEIVQIARSRRMRRIRTLFDYQLPAAVTHFPPFKHLGFGLFIELHGGSGGR
jgi:hypothetical protein